MEHSRKWNHPSLGSTIAVEPIWSVPGINRIKELIAGKPRDYSLFALGINTAFRASELLSIRVGQGRYLQPSDRLEMKQPKTKKYRSVTINSATHRSIQHLIAENERLAITRKRPFVLDDDAFLFTGQRGDNALRVFTRSIMVKNWCKQVPLKGKNGSHMLRKTWGTCSARNKTHPSLFLCKRLAMRHKGK